MIPAFSAHPSLATRFEAEIGAAMLASLRPKKKAPEPPPVVVERPSLTSRILTALRALPGQEGTLSDILRHLPDAERGSVKMALINAKLAGKVSITNRSSVGVWRVRGAE